MILKVPIYKYFKKTVLSMIDGIPIFIREFRKKEYQRIFFF